MTSSSYMLPTGTPVPSPSAASATAKMSTSGTTAVSLPKIDNGSSAQVTLPAVSTGGSATVTLQSSLPSGAIAPAVSSRGIDGIGPNTPLDYVIVSVDTTTSITTTPAFTFTLGAPPPSGSSTYIAVLDTGAAKPDWSIMLGPGTVSGNTVSFASQTLVPPYTLKAKDTYVFALVATSTPVTPPPPTIPPSTAATYSGTKTVAYAYGYDFDYPNPAPGATAPPQSLSYNVATTVTIGATPFPGTASAQTVDEHVSESDSSNLSSSTYATDSWIAFAPSGSGFNEELYGQTVQEPSSANLPTVTTLYNTPQTVDQLPETNSATWSNNPQSTTSYAYASGDAGTRTVAADGSYNDVEQLGPSSGGATVTMTENADGSGSIAGPYYGGGILDSISFSAPTPQPSASPLLSVTLSFSTFAQQYYGLPATQVINDDVWYPYTLGQAPVLYNETDSVSASASLPASCSASPYTAVNDVRRTIVTVDTIVGYVDSTQMDSYNANGFPVCMTTSDALGFAYSEQGTTPYTIYIGVKPDLVTVTTNESLVIQNQPVTAIAANRSAQAAQAHAFAAALQGHMLASLARERAQHVRSFLRDLRNMHIDKATLKGGRL